MGGGCEVANRTAAGCRPNEETTREGVNEGREGGREGHQSINHTWSFVRSFVRSTAVAASDFQFSRG